MNWIKQQWVPGFVVLLFVYEDFLMLRLMLLEWQMWPVRKSQFMDHQLCSPLQDKLPPLHTQNYRKAIYDGLLWTLLVWKHKPFT